MDFNYVFFPDHLTCKCTLYKKMRHFCDIGLHNCNFLLDYNDLTLGSPEMSTSFFARQLKKGAVDLPYTPVVSIMLRLNFKSVISR